MDLNTSKKRKIISGISVLVALAIIFINVKVFFKDGILNGVGLLAAALALTAGMGALILWNPTFSKGDGLRKRDYNKIFSLTWLFVAPFVTLILVECLNEVALWQLNPLILLGNYAFYLMLFGFVFALCNRIKWSVIITSSILYIFGLVNHFVLMFRGSPFIPMDFMAAKTAMNVAQSYHFTFTYNLILATLLFVIVILLSCKANYVNRDIRKQLLYRGSVIVSVVVVMFTFYQTDLFTNMGIKADLWNQSRGYRNSGSAVNFWLNTKYLFVDEPKAYSADKVNEIAEETDSKEVSAKPQAKEKPNIIAIMNETFSDLSVINDFETNEDYLPFWRSLKENTIKGNLFVSIHGSGTSNSEFEFLTGNTMAFLPAGSNAYELYIKEETQSLVSTLNDQGYTSQAVHPYYPNGWKRDVVYPLFGFKNFFSIDDFLNPQIFRRYISDKSSYDKIVDLYESKEEGEKVFLFDVTMQNHGGYDTQYDNFEETIHLVNPQGDYPKTQQYLSLIRESDNAYQQLIEYFSKVDEPTIIVMFGDHQPKIEDEFYEDLYGKSLSDLTLEEQQRRYTVPFMIWANYDIEEQEIDRISANYLSSLLLETAGLEMTPYNEYLLELYKTLPVVSGVGYVDKDGNYYDYDDKSPYTDLLDDYKMIQYNNLFDKTNKVSNFFSISGEKAALLAPRNRILG